MILHASSSKSYKWRGKLVSKQVYWGPERDGRMSACQQVSLVMGLFLHYRRDWLREAAQTNQEVSTSVERESGLKHRQQACYLDILCFYQGVHLKTHLWILQKDKVSDLLWLEINISCGSQSIVPRRCPGEWTKERISTFSGKPVPSCPGDC